MTILLTAISSLRPGSAFTVDQRDLSTLRWQDPQTQPPTIQEILAEKSRLEALMLVGAVKAEAQRRIIALTGKSNLQDCMIKQFNALMRAGQLTDKRVSGGTLTAEEETEAAVLRAMADRIKAIRAASDVIEAMSPIPVDYNADKWWPNA